MSLCRSWTFRRDSAHVQAKAGDKPVAWTGDNWFMLQCINCNPFEPPTGWLT